MTKLLKFEFRKLFRQKSFYVCSALLLVFVVLSAALSKLIAENAEEMAGPLPTAIGMLRTALQSANLTLIAGIFTALFVCADYTDGTLKNIYAKGFTRTSVYFSKLIAVLSASAVFCVVAWFGGFASGKVMFETGTGFNVNLLGTLFSQLIAVFAYVGLFFALAMIIRKTGGTIAACIVGPMLFSLLFTTADTVINNESFALSEYWLDGLFGKLTQTGVTGETMLVAALLSAVYAAVFIAVGCLINKKTQI